MKSTRAIFALCLIALLLNGLHAQEKVHLFISSYPFGATAVLNGKQLPGKTPLLIRNLDAGSYTVTLHREGYESTEQPLLLGDAAVTHHSVTLVPLYVQIPLRGQNVSVNGKPVQLGRSGFMIPQGSWSIHSEAGRIMLQPEYPFQTQLTVSKSATVIFSALTLLMSAYDLLSPIERSSFLSPFTYVCAGSAIASGSILTGYSLNKRTYLKTVSSLPLNAYENTFSGESLYQSAEERLADGDMNGALDAYSKILSEYPFSAYLPGVIYKSAKVNEILGDTALAARMYSILIENYPVPDFYDKSCYSLSLILEEEKDYAQCIEVLGKMVFFDPSYTPEEINARINALTERETEL